MGAAKKIVDKKLLKSLVPINALTPVHFNEIVAKAVIEEIPAGRPLFREGDRDSQTYYLLSGEIVLLSGNQVVSTLDAHTDAARYPVAQHQPRQVSAKAKGNIQIARIDTTLLDILLTSDQAGAYEVNELDSSDDDWMSRMLQSQAFLKLPPSNIQKLLMSMEEMAVKRGEVIINQGDVGDYYYIIKRGRCAVSRRANPDAQEVKLAELSEGDSFGEDALVSDSPRNATITMLTAGSLMRLSKIDFIALLREPLLHQVDLKQANALVRKGAVWLDVRLPGEFQTGSIENSLNIPLAALRHQMKDLDVAVKYIVVCDSGDRSSTAAFLLGQHGFDACILKGGLRGQPQSGSDDETQEGGADVINFETESARKKADTAKRAAAVPEPDAQTAENWKKAEQEAAQLLAEAKAARKQASHEAERLQAEARQILAKAEEEAGRIRARAESFLEEAQARSLELEEQATVGNAQLEALQADTAERLKQAETATAQAEQARRDAEIALEKLRGEARDEAQRLQDEAGRQSQAVSAAEAKLRQSLDAAESAQAEVERLRAELSALAATQQQQNAAHVAITDELSQTRAALARAETEAATATRALKEQSDTLKAELAQVRAEAEARIATLESALDEARSGADSTAGKLSEKIEAMKTKLDFAKQHILDLNAQKQDAEAAGQAAQAQIAQQQADLDAATKRAGEVESELSSLQDSWEQTKVETARELKMLKRQLAEQQTATETATARVAELNRELAAAQASAAGDTAAIAARLETAEATLQDRQSRLDSAEARIAEISAAHDAAQSKVAELQQSLEAARAEVQDSGSALQQQIVSLEQSLTESRAALSAAQRDSEAIAQARDTAQGEIDRLTKVVQEIETAAQTETAALRGELEGLQRVLQETRDGADARHAEHLAALTQAEAQAGERITALEAEVAHLQAALQTAETATAALQTEWDADRQAADAATQALQTENGTLQEQLEQLGRQLVEVRAQADAAVAARHQALTETEEAAAARLEALRADLAERETALASAASEQAALSARLAEQERAAEAEAAQWRTRVEQATQALTQAREAADTEIASLKSRIETLQAEADAALTRTSEEAAAEWSHQVEALRDELSQREVAAEAMVSEIRAALDQAHADAAKSATEHAGRQTELEGRIEHLQDKLEQANRLRAEAEQSAEDAANSLAELHAEIKNAHLTINEEAERKDSDLAVLSAELETLRKANDALTRELAASDETIAGYKAALTRADSRLSEIQGEIDDTEGARRKADDEVARLKLRISELQEEVKQATAAGAAEGEAERNLKRQVKTLEHDLAHLRSQSQLELTALREQLTIASEELNGVQAQQQARATEMEAHLSQARQRAAGLASELEEHRISLEQEMQARRKAESAQRAAQQEADALRAEAEVMRTLSGVSDEVSPDMQQLRAELIQAKQVAETSTREKSDAESALAAMEQEALRLKRQLQAAREELALTAEVLPAAAATPVVVNSAATRTSKPLLVATLVGWLAAAGIGAAWLMRDVAPSAPAPQRVVNEIPAAPESMTNTPVVSAGPITAPPDAETAAVPHSFRDRLQSGGVGPLMIRIKAGDYRMGSDSTSLNFDEWPAHDVSLRGFSIGRDEITFDEYDAFARATGRGLPKDFGWGRGKRPVVGVNWHDAVAYTKWLSAQTGARYRLPSEAEWEYAASAGNPASYWWGAGLDANRANCYNCGSEWDGKRTAPVGSFAANPFGLRDTVGNALEWVQDCRHESYQDAPADGGVWAGGDCGKRVARGGAFDLPALNVRSQQRAYFNPDVRLNNIGFRVVRE